MSAPLDCLVIGGGPAGLAAALYLARFRRSFALVDAGEPRAAWIPATHNIPFFAEGIAGPRILDLQRGHLARYGVKPLAATVTSLRQETGGFTAELREISGATRSLSARRVLLATGAVDVEPALPDLPDAVRRGLVRYCPICDGYEAARSRIAVIGHGPRGISEAIYIARTYGAAVTVLTLGQPLAPEPGQADAARALGIRLVEEPVAALEVRDGRIAALRTGSGLEHRFDTLYSTLGLRYRTALAAALGARMDAAGAVKVDDGGETSIPGLHAAGDIVEGLDQIVVGMGHAAIAATRIHKRLLEAG